MAAALSLIADQAAPPAAGDFLRVPLDAFRMQSAINTDLYCLPPGATTPLLYRSALLPLSKGDLDVLSQRGHNALYVLAREFAALEQLLREALPAVLADETLPPENKFAVLQSAMALEVDGAFRLANCARFVDLSHRVAEQITVLCSDDSLVPRKLFAMVRHDFYTFTHLTNVAGFTVLLAEHLGIGEGPERRQIAVGGLLHDLGKKHIPTDLLCKKGRPNEFEWDLIKSHPVRGYEELCDRNELSHAQLMMVYQHHERLDGKGYPVGMMGDEIHPWARMLAVCDVFDALTSLRPYRKPISWTDALNYLESHAGTHFDADMVKCWKSAMLQR